MNCQAIFLKDNFISPMQLKIFTKEQQEPKIRTNEVMSNYHLKHFVLTSLMLGGLCNGQKYRCAIRPNSPIGPWTCRALGEMEPRK
jgi:hypothetical protein